MGAVNHFVAHFVCRREVSPVFYFCYIFASDLFEALSKCWDRKIVA